MKSKAVQGKRKMIQLDVSSTSILVTCAECKYWYAFEFTREAAENSGCAHEEHSHPESTDFRRRVYFARAKRAARAVMSAQSLTLSHAGGGR